jgi:hypothetical protein
MGNSLPMSTTLFKQNYSSNKVNFLLLLKYLIFLSYRWVHPTDVGFSPRRQLRYE